MNSNSKNKTAAQEDTRFALFSYGFRPFFMVAGLYAIAGLGYWLWIYPRGISPLRAFPGHLWHGHEMLFGFVTAAIAGFMLTAVPSWTGTRGFAGRPLMGLLTLWLAGRVGFLAYTSLPSAAVAMAELSFLPSVAILIAPSLLRSRNRNAVLLLVLMAIWAVDAVFVYALLDGNSALGSKALRVGLDIILLLITVIGGRIVPAFTANALRRLGKDVQMRSRFLADPLVIIAMLALLGTDALPFGSQVSAMVALIAGLAHLWRLSGWQGHKTGSEPIVWILHVAYLWLPMGLLLKAAHLGLDIAWAAHWMHALGAGAVASMILAVMTRATLGHTGRPLVVGPAIVWAYALMIAAGLLRVFGPALLPVSYASTVLWAGIAWLGAFVLFALVYTPMFLGRRVDGKSG